MLSIGTVAQQAGLRTSAIRYYERLGLLPEPERRSGRRSYPPSILARLQVISFARASGFSLREIHKLFGGRRYSSELRALAQDKVVELERSIERARRMQSVLRSVMRCECLSPEECGRRLEAPAGRRR